MATVPESRDRREWVDTPDGPRLAIVHDLSGHEPDSGPDIDPNGVSLARRGLLRSVTVRDHSWDGRILEEHK